MVQPLLNKATVLEVLRRQIEVNAAISDLTDEDWEIMQMLAITVDCPLPRRDKVE